MRWLVGLLMWALMAAPVWAATTANSIVTTQTPKLAVAQLLIATGADTAVSVYTGGANGSKCLNPIVSNTDTSATHNVTFTISRSATTYYLGSITTTSPTTSAGTFGVSSITALASSASTGATGVAGLPNDSDGNPYIFLQNGDILQAQYHTTLTGALTPAAQITVTSVCADF